MATTLADIRAVNWQLSTLGLGKVVEGIDDIRQCIGIILTTSKGSDPLRPLFGSDIYRHIDKPVNIAVAVISAEILDSINKWEQRIRIVRLTYDIVGSRIDFSLVAELLESGQTTEILFYVDRQTQIDPVTVGRAFSGGFDFGFS